MLLRDYDAHKDKEAAHRIWAEIGWLEKDKEAIMDAFIEASRAHVAEVNGETECLALMASAHLRYIDQDLPMAACTGVTTSRVARKQRLASHLTARALAAEVRAGALIGGLSMFEQGYYNQLGYGTSGYIHRIAFDPALLRVNRVARIPRRFKVEDFEAIHAARLRRRRGHGACSLTPAGISKADMLWTDNGFGLGYTDAPDGSYSHGLWAGTKSVESGPYHVGFIFYQTADHFLELMALLRNLGDQVRLIRMAEPPGIQLQDLLAQPFKHRQLTEKSAFEMSMRAAAYFQFRICDLNGCLARTHLRSGPLRFNLTLTDPIVAFLDANEPWRGVGGAYVVTLGASSWAQEGNDSSLPTLAASVGAFTRLWLGVRPASGLAVTDDLSGPPELLEALDWLLCLPQPTADWDF